jgi:hypothetical protein
MSEGFQEETEALVADFKRPRIQITVLDSPQAGLTDWPSRIGPKIQIIALNSPRAELTDLASGIRTRMRTML